MEQSDNCLKELFTYQNRKSLEEDDVLVIKDKEFTFKVYKNIDQCQEYWPCILCEDPFYSPEYFKILESSSFSGAKPLYAFVFIADDLEPIASYYMQKKVVKLSDSIDLTKFNEGASLWAKAKNVLQRLFFPLVYFNMMVVGNLLLTGKYGFRGVDNQLKDADYDILKRLLKKLEPKLRKTEFKFRGALIKDMYEEERPSDPAKIGLGELQVDPNMIVPIHADWSSMDDYLLDMKSKHRVRTKKHLKQGASIEIKQLSPAEVINLDDEITYLYKSVVTASGFNLASAEKGYFSQMVSSFPNRFFLNGMFIEGKLIGFYTYMIKENSLLSHFIGYDESLNKKHSIYMNILLGLIKNSIEHKAENLYYYRTALEIKSSVGAEPHDMYCYLVHNNTLINKTVGLIIKTFFPTPVWTQRRPFKTAK